LSLSTIRIFAFLYCGLLWNDILLPPYSMYLPSSCMRRIYWWCSGLSVQPLFFLPPQIWSIQINCKFITSKGKCMQIA